jgi:hypothetical protein
LPRTYLIFGDIDGKLDVLNVECTKGRYHVQRLIEVYGRKGNKRPDPPCHRSAGCTHPPS